MRSGRFIATVAAGIMSAVPALAAPAGNAASTSVTANPAAGLSLTNSVRVGSAGHHKSGIAGIPLIYVALVAVGVGLGIAGAAGAFSSSN